jgi:hypothetical protein
LSLSTPESVQKLQTALHDKAKEAPSFRFYALYDKVYRKDVLAFAYECCKANGHPLLMLTAVVPFGATGRRIGDQGEWNPK